MDVNEVVSGIHFNLDALTLAVVARVILLILVGIVVIRVIQNLLSRMLNRSKTLTPLKAYIQSSVKVLLWFLLVLMVAEALGIQTSSLIAMLSIAGLAVSLALQNTLSNLAGGIMLLVAQPLQVGDFVEAEGISGTVGSVTLSYTAIITPDNKKIFVPNSHLAGAKIINYTVQGSRRVDLNFTASYDAPTEVVKAAIQEVLDADSRIRKDPAPAIVLSEYQSSSIQYTVRVWTATADYWDVYFYIQEAVRESFRRHQVEMTYDHLNVHILDK